MATLDPIPLQVKLFTKGEDGQMREMTFDEVTDMMNALTFQEYQKQAVSTAIYPFVKVDGNDEHIRYVYPAIGLCGEAGEVAEKVKKLLRDKRGVLTTESRDAVAKELGDVLWYVAAIAEEIGVSMADVAKANLEKLASRKERGVLGGSGDNR